MISLAMTDGVLLLVGLLASGALFTMLTIALTNAFTFPRLSSTAAPAAPLPAVAILLPARNEAANIGPTVTALLHQDYPALTVRVLDDNSEDDTAARALHAAGAANAPAGFQLLHGSPLPAGWTGKNWACAQLAAASSEPILIFTDADVHWEPTAVRAVVAAMLALDADLLTVWPTQITVTWGERLVVPLMALAVLGYLPLRLAHDFPHPAAAAANGQCMAFQRTAYTQINGHTAVKGIVVEDIRLAQTIKRAGLQLRMADGNRLICTRMYGSTRATIDGYTKNILAGHNGSVGLLGLSTLFHWTIFLGPWLWILAGAFTPLLGWPWWPLVLATAGIALRAITARATHQRVRDVLWMPASVLLMSWIAARAVWSRWRRGGSTWKGRLVPS